MSEGCIEGKSPLIEQLGAIYKSRESLEESWAAEQGAWTSILPKLAAEISFNYELRAPLGIGGSGAVFMAFDKNLSLDRALKVSRPTPGRERALADVLAAEISVLRQVNHQNIISIFAHGSVDWEPGPRRLPFYVMELVPAAVDLQEYVTGDSCDEAALVRVLSGLLEGLAYLHDRGIVHMDIKPSNVLVAPDGNALISDLGFAKQLSTSAGDTAIGGTDGYMHPEARAYLLDLYNPDQLLGKAPRQSLRAAWDLYSVGKTLLEILRVADAARPDMLSRYTRRYLRLLACRLLDGLNSEAELALGLNAAVLKELACTSAADANLALHRLSGHESIQAQVPELNTNIQETIQAASLAPVAFTRRVKTLVAAQAVTRLATVTQLGLLNLVYPTATHTRWEHSLGVFGITGRILSALCDDRSIR